MLRLLTQCVLGMLFLNVVPGFEATPRAWAQDDKNATAEECAELLAPEEDEYIPLTFDPLQIALEEHSLLDLIQSDPTKNLAVRSPSIVMNAFQRVYSWMNRYHPEVRLIPGGKGEFLVYPVFSAGVPEVGGKLIVGQYEQIEQFANFLRSGASGDGSAKRLFLFEGPPGTGKTEFLTIFGALGRNMTGMYQEHALYTFEWVNLSSIPELSYVPQVQHVNGEMYEHPTRCPIHDSPFTLLPTKLQNAVLKTATPAVHAQIGQMAPRPVRHACPKCSDIKKHLLTHYAKLKGGNLDEIEQVQALAKHVRIKRWVQGDSGADSKINAEGRDIDWQGLAGTPNPVIFSQFGPNNPHAYFFNGKLTSGNGGMTMFDEFLRNEGPFLDFVLEVVENGKIVRGGMPTITVDSVFIGATNRESLNEKRSNKAIRALIDRMRKKPLMWTINPYEIAKTQLLMKGKELFARELRTSDVNKRTISTIMPLPEHGMYLGPDGRYDLSLKNGSEMIHIAPHTLMYMASVVSATRMSTDKVEAGKLAGHAVIDTQYFQDRIARLRWLLGDDKSLNGSQERELNELNLEMGEGNFGISSRNASDVWLSATIEEAHKRAEIERAKNPGKAVYPCITPKLAQEILEKLLRSDSIEHENYSSEKRKEWVQISRRVLQEIYVKKISSDMADGIHPSVPTEQIAEALYNRIIAELSALKLDPKATTFHFHDDPFLQHINHARLEEISKLYQDATLRPLDPHEVLFLDNHQDTRSPAGTSPIPVHPHYEPLMNAVRTYVDNKKTDIGALLSELSLSAEAVDQLPKHMLDSLHQHYGYCPHCAQELFEWIRAIKNK